MFEFINSERVREHLKPLEWDADLYPVALAHSKDMASTEQMSHKGSDGREPHERIQEAGIYASKTAENIARDLSASSAHTMLMQSLDHRENILEPDFTHGAVGIAKKGDAFFITELFIRKVREYSSVEARQLLLRQYNSFRERSQRLPLIPSEALSNVAQSHAELQERLNGMSPLLLLGVLSRRKSGSVLYSVYTTTDLSTIPSQVEKDLESDLQKLGIGFKRIRGALCSGGCYLIVLLFG